VDAVRGGMVIILNRLFLSGACRVQYYYHHCNTCSIFYAGDSKRLKFFTDQLREERHHW
jgi:hypothetical protein